MKKLCDRISDNTRQIVEIIVLIIVIIVPWIVNLQNIFKEYLTNNPISPDNFLWQIAFKAGKPIAAFILFCAALKAVRKFNQGFVMNRKRVYHDYSYAWYWFCAKVLGIKSCNLVLVPIYMQFKLIIRATFAEYPLEDNEYPVEENETDITISEQNHEKSNEEINLILEDTYVIEAQQIPKSKQAYRTIKISRNNGSDSSRHFSQKYINGIINCVRGLKEEVTINVYATTNPLNTKHIAERAFGLGERGNIKHLYVFQQSKDGRRLFEDKGIKVF